MFNFEHSLYGYFEQEVNEIWYLGRPVNAPPRYHMTFCIKWSNSKHWKLSICSKSFCATQVWFFANWVTCLTLLLYIYIVLHTPFKNCLKFIYLVFHNPDCNNVIKNIDLGYCCSVR